MKRRVEYMPSHSTKKIRASGKSANSAHQFDNDRGRQVKAGKGVGEHCIRRRRRDQTTGGKPQPEGRQSNPITFIEPTDPTQEEENEDCLTVVIGNIDVIEVPLGWDGWKQVLQRQKTDEQDGEGPIDQDRPPHLTTCYCNVRHIAPWLSSLHDVNLGHGRMPLAADEGAGDAEHKTGNIASGRVVVGV